MNKFLMVSRTMRERIASDLVSLARQVEKSAGFISSAPIRETGCLYRRLL